MKKLYFLALMILFFSVNGQDTCILYGPFYLNMQQPHSYFNFTFISATDTITLKNFLNQVKQNNYYVALNLTGSRQNFQGPNNEFDLNKFKQLLNKFANFDFSPYYNRIICHLLFDEPHDPSNWGGTTVAFSTIDSAAAYSKLLFPALKTGVGAPATWLSQYGLINTSTIVNLNTASTKAIFNNLFNPTTAQQ